MELNIKAILESHAKWLAGEPGGERATFTDADLTDANLTDADLTGASFTGANFTGATLIGADFSHANCTGADFTHANCTGADFTGANFTDADLTRANCTDANFTDADLTHASFTDAELYRATLSGAILDGTVFSARTLIETGETWQEYLDIVVPAFLTAGGRPLGEVATPEHWDCHSWDNCPTAAAFRCHGIEGVPLLLQPRARQFIRYFDGGIIPLAAVRKEARS